jgi:Family of unknown function (DUF5678)
VSEHESDQPLEESEDDAGALPEHDLEHYSGQWVAVRAGRVIAHDPDPEALQADPAVHPTDDVFPVGDPPSGFYTVSA